MLTVPTDRVNIRSMKIKDHLINPFHWPPLTTPHWPSEGSRTTYVKFSFMLTWCIPQYWSEGKCEFLCTYSVQGTHLFEELKYEAWISYHVTLAVSEIVSYNHLLHTLHTMHCVNLVKKKPDKLHPWVVFEGTNSDSPTSEPTSHMRQKVVLDWKQTGERENKTWKLHLKNYSTKPVMITWYNRRQPQELKSTPSMQVQDWASKIQPPGSSLCL